MREARRAATRAGGSCIQGRPKLSKARAQAQGGVVKPRLLPIVAALVAVGFFTASAAVKCKPLAAKTWSGSLQFSRPILGDFPATRLLFVSGGCNASSLSQYNGFDARVWDVASHANTSATAAWSGSHAPLPFPHSPRMWLEFFTSSCSAATGIAGPVLTGTSYRLMIPKNAKWAIAYISAVGGTPPPQTGQPALIVSLKSLGRKCPKK